jgi:hypothetical protein
MADTFYLNLIREQKAEQLETAEETLESYQAHLQQESNPGNLKPYLHRFHYGSFLKAALNDFKETNNTLQITEVHVEQVQEPFKETLSFPRSSSRKKKAPEETRLTLRGQIRGDLQTEAPYQQLNETLSIISQETGCTLQLFKGSETLPKETKLSTFNTTEAHAPFQFELQLFPKHQKQCWQRYTRPKGGS